MPKCVVKHRLIAFSAHWVGDIDTDCLIFRSRDVLYGHKYMYVYFGKTYVVLLLQKKKEILLGGDFTLFSLFVN